MSTIFPTPSEEGRVSRDTFRQFVDFDLSLRDYFAAKAMQVLIHDIYIDQPTEDLLIGTGIKPEQFPSYLAHLAYGAADAMLEVRNWPPEEVKALPKPSK
jgi:hypothetical protein